MIRSQVVVPNSKASNGEFSKLYRLGYRGNPKTEVLQTALSQFIPIGCQPCPNRPDRAERLFSFQEFTSEPERNHPFAKPFRGSENLRRGFESLPFRHRLTLIVGRFTACLSHRRAQPAQQPLSQFIPISDTTVQKTVVAERLYWFFVAEISAVH
jgi:hypothetical protein